MISCINWVEARDVMQQEGLKNTKTAIIAKRSGPDQ